MTRLESAPLPRWVSLGLAAAALLVVAAASLLWVFAAQQRRGALPDLASMPAFHLTDQENRPVTEADVTGKVTLVGFIYTSCDDICPMLTAQMKSLQEELRSAGLLGEVQLVSITVDPEYDTPAVLKEYAAHWGADTTSWRFLTGEPDHVRQVVVKGFLLGMQRVESTNTHAGHGESSTPNAPVEYRVEHSGRIALVDQAGKIRAYYEGTALDRLQVLSDVRRLTGAD